MAAAPGAIKPGLNGISQASRGWCALGGGRHAGNSECLPGEPAPPGRDATGAIGQARKQQMAAPSLQEPARKAPATLDRERDGLIAHREYPVISLDDNLSERALRRPAVTRKNACGSRTGDAARLAAMIRAVTATAGMTDLNVPACLTACPGACGRNGGKPLSGSGPERFLPWNAVPGGLRAWAQPPPPG
jgi:hypothetical protein